MRALRCRARAHLHFSCWSAGLLVLDEALVGELGLFGERSLGISDSAAAGPGPGVWRGVFRSAGFDFKPAELLGGQ